MADERTRYSDAELEEFKQLILKKLENARADYELLRATITTRRIPPRRSKSSKRAQRPSRKRRADVWRHTR
jgi:hypothetical protein